jgi:hypothetical protein
MARTSARERSFETRTYTDEMVLGDLREEIKYRKNAVDSALRQFVGDFAKDSAHAFEWSATSFENAARLKMIKLVESYLDHDHVKQQAPRCQLEIMRGEFKAEVLRRAKWPECSTSPTSNFMNLCVNAARAEWLETIEKAIDRIGTEYRHYL